LSVIAGSVGKSSQDRARPRYSGCGAVVAVTTGIEFKEGLDFYRDNGATFSRLDKFMINRLLSFGADESGYDETVWETVKTAIEDNQFSERRWFDV
jgi:hypothetical protein